MITQQQLNQQLKRIGFNPQGWGRTEAHELCNILHEREEIEECVNGYYDAGFALLVATKNRLLLVDKKPLSYLTVEDMRFDMINEFDYSHRLFGAQVTISSGSKTFNFKSTNKIRLRNLVTFVQDHMSHTKNETREFLETQKMHLEQMNQRLQMYLDAAHKQQYLAQANAIEANKQMQTATHALEQVDTAVSAPDIPIHSTSDFERVVSMMMDRQQQQPYEPRPKPQPLVATRSDSATSGTSASRYSQALQIVMTPQQIAFAAARRVLPVISAYSRMPVLQNRRSYGLGQQQV